MADSTVSALPAAAALGGTELLYGVQSAADVKITATQMRTFAATGLATLGANTFTALQTITQASANAGILASTGYSLTGASAQSMVDLAGTLNTSGSPDVIALRITDTARGAATTLLNLYGGASGTTSMFSVGRTGAVTIGTGGQSLDGTGNFFINYGGARACLNSGGGSASWSTWQMAANGSFGFSSSSNNANAGTDTHISRRAAANILLGATDAAAPVAQTLSVQSVVAGTSNTAGANFIINGSQGTGNGIAGKIIFNLSQIVAAATTQNASSPVLSLNTIAASGIQFNQYGAGALSTDASGNITATSDERLKHVEGPFAAGLEELMGIEPILYKWREESGMETKHLYAGLGASNVRETIPEAVGMSGAGYLTLSDRALLAACVNAIKQLAQEMRH